MKNTANLEQLMSLPQVDLQNVLETDLARARRLHEICGKEPSEWSDDENELLSAEIARYSPNQYSTAKYAGGYFVLTPRPRQMGERRNLPLTVQDIDTGWDARKFLQPRAPVTVARLNDRKSFDRPGAIRCLHLPVKFPGTEVRVPDEYGQFREMLQCVLDYETGVNPSYADYHAYLTVDQRFVPGGQVQRLPGAHVDGIPRDRIRPNSQRIDHSYIVTNNIPTRFYTHSFPIAEYDLNRHNFFALMRYFADESRSLLTEPYDVTLMNAYSVHTSIEAQRHYYRTFVRLEFSVLEFDRRGNAISPCFDYNWHYRDCPIPAHLDLPAELKADLEKCAA